MQAAFLYKWTNKATGMWYVGCRTAKGCSPQDGYVCSSKHVKPLIEASPSDWDREILMYGDNNPAKRDDVREKISASLQGHAPTRTSPHSEETKAKMSAKRKAYWAQKRAEKISNV